MVRIACLLSLLFLSSLATAQTVRFETNMGDFDVELFTSQAPVTVNNFMNYVNDGDYSDSIVHRSVPNFVIQGGGYTAPSPLVGSFSNVTPITTDPPIQNEFGVSNLRGTIAMAKLGGNPDSATSQWFINLTDNALNLDNQNGGFTVFGEVIGSGMNVVDAIASLEPSNIDQGVFGQAPVIASETDDQFVVVNNISVVPEPGGATLVLLSLLGLQCLRRRSSSAR